MIKTLEVIDRTEVRIFLVDDHAIVRQGVASILEREPDLLVVGQAATAIEALEAIRLSPPDIVVMDLKLSAGSDREGLELCKHIVAEYPALGVLILTTFLDQQLVVRAVQAGARGYVVKDVDLTELVGALRAISRGQNAFDAQASNMLVSSMRGGQNDPETDVLTAREQDVLELLAHGMSNHAIGVRLFISPATVKFHVSNLMRKLRVSRRAEAVYEASKRGLI